MQTHFRGKVSVRAIILKDGKVLVTRDPKDNMWETPGGRIDEGEGIIDGLHREMREELGVDVVVGDVVHSGQFLHIRDNAMQLTVTFACTLADPQSPLVLQKDEIVEARWVTVDEVDALEPLFGDCRAALQAYWQR